MATRSPLTRAPGRRAKQGAVADMLRLEPDGPDCFVAAFNASNAYGTLFGGQILGQAAAASSATVQGQELHALHATFLRTGSPDSPTRLHVERLRDGRRITSRQVRILQNDAVLAVVACSHRSPLAGFDHQQPPSFSLSPDDAVPLEAAATHDEGSLLAFAGNPNDAEAIEVRVTGREGYFAPHPDARRRYWLRARSLAGQDDAELHRQALIYLSDYLMPGASLVPHTVPLPGKHVFVASLDHGIWIHRPLRCDDWLLFETDSPSACAGAGLSRALVYDTAGRLVATIVQESMQLPTGEPAL